MWNKIKQYIFEPKMRDMTTIVVDNNLPLINDAQEALARYCPLCKTGFKSKAGRAAHMAIKHKNG